MGIRPVSNADSKMIDRARPGGAAERRLRRSSNFGALLWGIALLAPAACSTEDSTSRELAGSSDQGKEDASTISSIPEAGAVPPGDEPVVIGSISDASGSTVVEGGCKNLQCKRTACSDGGTTSLTGKVYAPNGTLPIYNALVYIPNAPLPPVTQGLSCDRCGGVPPGEPVGAGLTDATGAFRLQDIPVGTDIPVVFQVGKWRRKIVIPEIEPCIENRLTDPEMTRLPRNRQEGDMPRIAITTGSCDNLICLLPKLGIDPDEWGIEGEDKAVTFFSGASVDFDTYAATRFDAHLSRMTSAEDLWGKPSELDKYDMAILSCECSEAPENKGAAAYDAVTKYLAAGGRVFGTDYQYVWYKHSTDPALAGAATIPGTDPSVIPNGTSPIALDTSFPKGKALADWLSLVVPDDPYGNVACDTVVDNFRGVVSSAVQVWGGSSEMDSAAVHPRIMTINAPVGLPAEQQCGKAIHVDAHVSPVGISSLAHYPADCGTNLQNGEQVLAFFFFDVASCIQADNKPPIPPPIMVH